MNIGIKILFYAKLKKENFMAQKKYTILSIIFVITLLVGFFVSFGITFAWFTDKESAGPSSISFGSISIDLNSENKGVLTPTSVVPGGNIFTKSIKFNLNPNSSACYVRAKYAVSDNTAGGGV